MSPKILAQRKFYNLGVFVVFAQGVFAYVYITVQEVPGSGLVWRSPRQQSCKISPKIQFH